MRLLGSCFLCDTIFSIEAFIEVSIDIMFSIQKNEKEEQRTICTLFFFFVSIKSKTGEF